MANGPRGEHIHSNFAQFGPDPTRAIGLTPGSSTLVDINIPPSTLGWRVNATPKSENEGIVTSEFNLTSPGSVPLVLQIIPIEPRRVAVFVRRDAVPTSTDYDWLLTESVRRSTRTIESVYDLLRLVVN